MFRSEAFLENYALIYSILRHIQWDMHGRCTFSSSGYCYLFPKAALGVLVILSGVM